MYVCQAGTLALDVSAGVQEIHLTAGADLVQQVYAYNLATNNTKAFNLTLTGSTDGSPVLGRVLGHFKIQIEVPKTASDPLPPNPGAAAFCCAFFFSLLL